MFAHGVCRPALPSLLLLLILSACDADSPDSRAADGADSGTQQSGCTDRDNDGVCGDGPAGPARDCDDSDAERHPGAAEVCNRIDDNCDGQIDETGSACPYTCEVPSGGCDEAKDLAVGSNHACLGTAQGRVYCWGSNYNGELGNPELTHSSTPIQVPGIAGYKELLRSATCVRRDTDAVCWGGDTASPVVVPLPNDARSVVRVMQKLCWLDAADVLWCRAILTADSAPTMALTGVQAISSGFGKLCALLRTGRVTCRTESVSGAGEFSALNEAGVTALFVGDDDRVCLQSPRGLLCDAKVIAGNESAVQVETSRGKACARGADGRVACWAGEAPALQDVETFGLGTDFGCVLGKDKKVACWGRRQNGQLGDGEIGATPSEQQLAPLRPGRQPPHLSSALLGTGKLGACDNSGDLLAITLRFGLHADVRSCQTTCQGRLDFDACARTCHREVISPGCLSCFTAYASCPASQTDCYAQFRACVGFAPEFVEPHGSPPNLSCERTGCIGLGNAYGESCSKDADCLGRSCARHPFAAMGSSETICVARGGSSCTSRSSAHCTCPEGKKYCGSCSGKGQAALDYNNFSEPDSCGRSCTESDQLCELHQQCRFFADSSSKYCDER